MDESNRTSADGCFGPLLLLAIVVVVAGILVWEFGPSRRPGPHPATLAYGDVRQQGEIGHVCWPGIESESDNDVCPNWCDDDAPMCWPGDPLLVPEAATVTIDFSETGIPSTVSFGMHPLAGRQRDAVQYGHPEQLTESVMAARLDVPPGEYVLWVIASFPYQENGQWINAEYGQGYRLTVTD